MNTNRIEITQSEADAIERAYPMHGATVQGIFDRAEAESLARNEAAALAKAELAMNQWRASNPGVFEWLGGVA